MELTLGLDIGGSAVKGGLVPESSLAPRVDECRRLTTRRVDRRTWPELYELVCESVSEALTREPEVSIIGISTTGLVSRAGLVIRGGVFEGYDDVSWHDELERAFPGQFETVTVVNDGQAAAWASYRVGITGTGTLVHLVIGTGVGGGIVAEGNLLLGEHGLAGHMGHVKVVCNRMERCVCGSHGCVELGANAEAIARYASSDGTPPNSVALSDIRAAALCGDRRALQAFTCAGETLGLAISDMINVLNPAVVTLGGGVVEAANLPQGNPYVEGAARVARQEAIQQIAADTRLEISRLGNDAGIIGATDLASRRTRRAPVGD